jgi:hypothetical protein
LSLPARRGQAPVERSAGGGAGERIGLGVEEPHRPRLPVERLAHHLDDPRGRFFEGRRLRDDPGDGGQSLLRPLASGDVEEIALGEQGPAVPVGHDEALVLHPHRPPVPRDQPVLGPERLRRLVAVLHEIEDSLAAYSDVALAVSASM